MDRLSHLGLLHYTLCHSKPNRGLNFCYTFTNLFTACLVLPLSCQLHHCLQPPQIEFHSIFSVVRLLKTTRMGVFLLILYFQKFLHSDLLSSSFNRLQIQHILPPLSVGFPNFPPEITTALIVVSEYLIMNRNLTPAI